MNMRDCPEINCLPQITTSSSVVTGSLLDYYSHCLTSILRYTFLANSDLYKQPEDDTETQLDFYMQKHSNFL